MDFIHPFFVVRILKPQNCPSMQMYLLQSQGGVTCRAIDSLVTISFHGEYPAVRIGVVVCKYAPDRWQLDTWQEQQSVLPFQHDAAKNLYNATMRNLYDTMQTIIRVMEDSLMIFMASAIAINSCMLIGPTSGWSDAVEYNLLSQFQLGPLQKNIICTHSWQMQESYWHHGVWARCNQQTWVRIWYVWGA
jgi:hypothetical protein